MPSYLILLSCLLSAHVYTKQCSLIDGDSITAVFKEQEQSILTVESLFTPIKDQMIKIESHKETLNIRKPIGFHEQLITQDVGTIISTKVFKYQNQWTNAYTYLSEKNNQYDIYYSHKKEQRLPDYQKVTTIGSTDHYICYDICSLEYNVIVVDCSIVNTQPIENVFIIYDTNTNTKVEHPSSNTLQYNTNKHRRLNCQEQYIYRSYLQPDLDANIGSSIEVYMYITQSLLLHGTLTQLNMRQLLKNQQYKFSIVDSVLYDAHYMSYLDIDGSYIKLRFIEDMWSLTSSSTLQSNAVVYDSVDDQTLLATSDGVLYYYSPDKHIQLNLGTKPIRVYISQNFLIIQKVGQIVIYNKDDITITSVQNIDNIQQLLVDQLNNELIVINKESTQRYILSKYGAIIAKPTVLNKEPLTAQIVQSTTNGDCIIQYTFYNLEQQDQSIIQVDNPKFISTPISLALTTLQYGTAFYGPNLLYTAEIPTKGDSNVILLFTDITPYILTGVTWKQPQLVTFTTILPHQSYFYFVQQYNDLSIIILMCQDDNLLNSALCATVNKLTLTIQLTQLNNQLWIDGGFIYLATIEPTNLKIYQITYDINRLVYNVDQQDEKQYYSQILHISDKLYVLQAQSQRIQVISTKLYVLVFIINEDLIKQQGQTLQNPKQLYGDVNSNILIIRDNNQLLFLRIQPYTVVVIKQMVIAVDSNIDITVFSHHIIIFTHVDEDKLTIQKYNYILESNIYLESELPVYGYQFPIKSYTYSYSANTLYIYAKDPITSMNIVLIYQVDQLAHQSLVKVLLQNNQQNQCLMSAGSDFVYINDRAGQQFYYRPPKMIVTATTQFLTKYYATTVDKKISITNGIAIKVFIQTLQIINTQYQIITKQNQLKFNTRLRSSTYDSCTDLGDAWYIGQASLFSVKCTQCNENISIQSPIQASTHQKFEQPIDVKPYNSKHLIVLNSFGLRYIDGTLTNYRDTTFLAGVQCSAMDVFGDLVYLACKQAQTYTAYIYMCMTGSCERYLGPLTINIRATIVQLFTNMAYIANNQEYSIYRMVNNEQTLFKSGTFDVQQVDSKMIREFNRYLLFTLDKSGLLQIQEIDSDVKTMAKLAEISITELILAKSQYLTEHTLFGQFDIQYHEKDQFIIVELLFTTSDVAHYAFEFIFDCKSDKCILGVIELQYILQQYGNWLALPQLKVNDGKATIIYQNLDRYLTAVYTLSTGIQDLKPITMIGGVESEYIPNTMLAYPFQDHLLTNLDNQDKLQFYDVHQSPSICMKGAIEEQVVTLSAYNHFYTSPLYLELQYLREDGTQSLWWLWLLIMLVVLGGVGYLVYMYNKKRRRNEVLLGNQ